MNYRNVLALVAASVLVTIPAFASDPAPGSEPQAAAQEVKGDVRAAAQAWELIEGGALVIDVRTPEEFGEGHIEGALNIPYTETAALAEAIGPDKERPVVLYCRSGRRSGVALKQLEGLGFSKLFNGTGYTALEATRP